MKKCLYLIALALFALVGCVKEQENNRTVVNSGDKVYMKFKIQAIATRSTTDTPSGSEGDKTNSNASPDYEVGLDVENKITSVDVILYNKDLYDADSENGGGYILARNIQATGSGDTYVAAFNSVELKADTEYQVYIYANCLSANPGNPDHLSTGIMGTDIATITTDNKFWMTNAYEAQTVTIPADMSSYRSPANPLNLGAHYVERVMARMDIKPYNNNVYDLGNNIKVTLTDAALINNSIHFYMLRRVSADGTNTSWTVGGTETPYNYVVSANWDVKVGGNVDYYAQNGLVYHSYLSDSSTWEWKSISTDNLTVEDNWDNSTETGYYIWQYCKEDTTPKNVTQTKEVSTCVVFRGKIEDTSSSLVAHAMGRGEDIYVYQNVLYGSWEDVEAKSTLAGAVPSLYSAYQNVEAAAEADRDAALAANGFTRFSAVNEGTATNPEYVYYTYYYYYNRHNDNDDPTESGPMEFAVVRNNVYKLCVKSINKFGHPAPGEPDPDPEVGTDPVESPDYYFNVTAKVLPWVVRVNDIEF